MWNSSGSQKLCGCQCYTIIIILKLKIFKSLEYYWFLPKLSGFWKKVNYRVSRCHHILEKEGPLCKIMHGDVYFKFFITIFALILMSLLSTAGGNSHCFKLIHSRLVMMQKCHHISECYIFKFHVCKLLKALPQEFRQAFEVWKEIKVLLMSCFHWIKAFYIGTLISGKIKGIRMTSKLRTHAPTHRGVGKQ